MPTCWRPAQPRLSGKVLEYLECGRIVSPVEEQSSASSILSFSDSVEGEEGASGRALYLGPVVGVSASTLAGGIRAGLFLMVILFIQTVACAGSSEKSGERGLG